MSTHFLFDVNTNPVANSKLRDVRRDASSSPIRGTFVVRVGPDLILTGNPPTDLNSLITAKYNALMAFYPTYGHIVFDEMAEGPGLDFTVTTKTKGAQIGSRGTVVLQPNGFVTTTMSALATTPATAVLTWEAYSITFDDFRDSIPTKSYVEAATSNITAQVSFNNGGTFHTVSPGALINIALVDQGNQLLVKFTNAFTSPLCLGSWALVY